ncbi:MAG TPA: hypothetical protein PK878_12215 [bacterium]|nr:hypothetical protein [bacterium]
MTENRKPTLEELSLFYDGLLDEEEARRVAASLEENEPSRCLLAAFGDFDAALRHNLPEDQFDSLLRDNLKHIQERLAGQERRARPRTASVWGWFLNPWNLAAGFAGILILFCVFSLFEQQSGVAPQIAVQIPSGMDGMIPEADTGPVTNHVSLAEMKDAALTEAQKGAILALASLARSALSTGFEYAKETTSPLGKTLESLPETSELGLAVSAIRSSVPQPAESVPESPESTLNPASATIARTGTRQLALGLGTTLLSMICVF